MTENQNLLKIPSNSKNEPSYETINPIINKESKCLNTEVYYNIMNSKITPVHITALSLHILSLVSFSLIIFQMLLISTQLRDYFFLTIFEMSMLVSLIFLGIAGGIIFNSFYLDEEVTCKMKVVICSSISIGLLLVPIISDSISLIFLCYPLISVFCSIIFYSIKNYFDEMFLSPKYDVLKTSLISVFTMSFLLVYLNLFFFMQKWRLYLISSVVLNFSILILSLFIIDTPIYWFKLKQNDLFITQLEKIKEDKIIEGEREVIIEELQKMVEEEKSTKLSSIFQENISKFSIIYFTINCLISFNTIGVAIISTSYWHDVLLILDRSFNSLLYFLIICVTGPLLGWLLSNYTTIQRKIYIISHFILLIALAFLMIFFNLYIQFFGGSFFFICLSLIVLFLKYGLEVYSEEIHKKIVLLFNLTLFSFAFITVHIINPLYFYSLRGSLICIIISSTLGLILSFFLDKDII